MAVDPLVVSLAEAQKRHMAGINLRLREQRDAIRSELRAELKEELRAELLTELRAMVPAPVPGPKGDPSPPGRDGKDADMDALARVAERAAKEAVAAIPSPRDGRDGASLTDMALLVSAEVQRAFTALPVALPQPKDGRDGKDADLSAIGPLVSAEVSRAVAALPAPRDGGRGAPGKDGKDGQNGRDGASREELESIALRMLDDLLSRATIEGRTLTIGKRQFEFPAMVWQGLWKEGADYLVGDVVTRSGSSWICQEAATKDAPGMGTSGWGLMVRHGRG